MNRVGQVDFRTEFERTKPQTYRDFPQTRFHGSKYKLLKWIKDSIEFLDFTSVADLFSGTGSVSYLFKTMGKRVVSNDILRANQVASLALVENRKEKVPLSVVQALLSSETDVSDGVIERGFNGIYFTDEENRFLDRAIRWIDRSLGDSPYRRAIMLWALFQACIIKRPYNLFHRKNLYVRTNDVPRSFGNKTTWDRPFEHYLPKFVKEANRAVFDNGESCIAVCHDALELPGEYDLVYIDPPYISSKGVGVDYHHFYHFLEGICHYDQWTDMMDLSRKHHPLKPMASPWIDSGRISEEFRKLIERYRHSHIVISYRIDGIPSIEDLVKMVSKVKKRVRTIETDPYRYVLSTNGESKEVLVIGWD